MISVTRISFTYPPDLATYEKLKALDAPEALLAFPRDGGSGEAIVTTVGNNFFSVNWSGGEIVVSCLASEKGATIMHFAAGSETEIRHFKAADRILTDWEGKRADADSIGRDCWTAFIEMIPHDLLYSDELKKVLNAFIY